MREIPRGSACEGRGQGGWRRGGTELTGELKIVEF